MMPAQSAQRGGRDTLRGKQKVRGHMLDLGLRTAVLMVGLFSGAIDVAALRG